MTGLVSVVVPVYRPVLSEDEELSFRRTICVLGKYPITIVCPFELDISYYEHISSEYNVVLWRESFRSLFFQGIKGYNRLLLSKAFYQRFSDYEYILICQLDAYIFRDELVQWCNLGYDYIGAPLIGNGFETTFSSMMRVGNGGLSLRKVQTYISFFESKKNVFSSSQIRQRISLKKKPYARICIWFLMLLGWHNKPMIVAERWKSNEDIFWSNLLDFSQYALSKPSPDIAMFFSFERFPSELFSIIGRLPFGCHAWRKYQFESFWQQYIKSIVR